MTFDILYLNQTNVIIADGTITPDTPKRFREFLATDPLDGHVFFIAFNSPGGNLLGGLELGKMIRSEKFNTIVLKYQRNPASGKFVHDSEEAGACHSACALAFLGGVRRSVPPQSKLGFHQFSSAGATLERKESVLFSEARSQIIGALLLDYIVQMGINPILYSTLSKTLPYEMHIPEPHELRKLNITTKTAFQEFQFEPYGNGVIAYAQFPENAIGREYVYQITTYCKSGTPFVLLSGNKARTIPSDVAKSLAVNQTGFSISSKDGSIQYGSDAVSVRRDGITIAEIRLDDKGARWIKSKMQGNINLGNIFGIFSFEVDPDRDDARKIEASFRHCIS